TVYCDTMSLSCCCLFFFFKQKTAYEIGLGIPAEPLFRSVTTNLLKFMRASIKLCRLDTPIIFIEARINLSRFVVTGCAAKTSATVTFPSLNLISLFAFCFNIWRSEERRVGKELRSEMSHCL